MKSTSVPNSIIRTIATVVKRVANLCGFDVIRKQPNHAEYVTHLLTLLGRYEIDCVLDVGANVGQFGRQLRNAGYEGWIVSFEPVARVHSELSRESANDGKWIAVRVALSDRDETRSINTYKSTEFSSFMKVSDYAKSTWSSLESEAGTESVDTRRLDTIFGQIQRDTGASRFYLKLDTQGYDLFAFRGASGVLNKVLAMQSEVSVISVYEGVPNRWKVLEEFETAGFMLSGAFPINRDPGSLAVVEFDCTFVRNEPH